MVFPDLCVDGTLSNNVCGAYPDMCDSTKPEDYNPCAENLFDCILDANFDLCTSFPELCGITSSFTIPLPVAPPAGEAGYTKVVGKQTMYTCKAELTSTFSEVMEVLSTLQYAYDFNLEARDIYDLPLMMGARVYADENATTFTNAVDLDGKA